MTQKEATLDENFIKIKLANESIKTTDIKGKEYAEVNQRIKAFRMVHPLGSIKTDIVSLENGTVTMKTEVLDENGVLIATGYSQEKEGSTFINKTSFIENCETSAVGRALGIAGYGIDTSICSAEELKNALANQDGAKPAKPAQTPMTEEQKNIINGLEDKLKSWLLKKFSINELNQLTAEQASWFINEMKKKEAK